MQAQKNRHDRKRLSTWTSDSADEAALIPGGQVYRAIRCWRGQVGPIRRTDRYFKWLSVRAGDCEAAEFHQSVAVGACRNQFEAGDGAVGIIASQACGVVQCARGLDGAADAFQVFDTAFLDRLAHQ